MRLRRLRQHSLNHFVAAPGDFFVGQFVVGQVIFHGPLHMSKAKHTLPQPAPRICLFCERIANSPEHMWPDWAGKYFDKGAHDKSLETYQMIGGHLPTRVIGPPKIMHGHPTTRKIKVVCKGCNNGWMSGMETAAKPFLEPMLQGHRLALDADAQRTLAQWITLKMMVWEQTEPRGIVFTRPQTLAFRGDRAIPANTRIWLMRSQGQWLRYRVGRSYSGIYEKGTEITKALMETANTQTVLFGIGKLLIFFVYSHLAELEIGEFRQLDATAIWPSWRPTVQWPPMRAINDAKATYIIGTLDRYLKRPTMFPI